VLRYIQVIIYNIDIVISSLVANVPNCFYCFFCRGVRIIALSISHVSELDLIITRAIDLKYGLNIWEF